jgi:hypothetical protein
VHVSSYYIVAGTIRLIVRLGHVMKSREAVRQHRAAAGKDLPDGGLDFPPIPEARTVRRVARHVPTAGAGMLLTGETNFAMAGLSPRLIRQGRTIPDNRTAVERAAAPAGFDSGLFTRLHGQPVRRLETLEMLEEHEFDASRAALLYLRLQALVPVATWRRESPDKRRAKEADCRITVGNLGGMSDGHLSGMRGSTRSR